MTDIERYNTALEYATEKHKGQQRINKVPYITHPVAVAEIIKEKGLGIDYQLTALFHDLLEDTDAEESDIERLGSKEILHAVKLLTKKKGYIMAEYVRGIKENPIAYAVKSADRLHNLRCAACTDTHFKQKLIKETIDWYIDFSPEIVTALNELVQQTENPIPKPSENRVSYLQSENGKAFALKGDICYSKSPTELSTVAGGYAVCENGKVSGVYPELPERLKGIAVYDYSNKLIIPGLVDLHIHAPQYAFRGTGMDLELMDWLQYNAFSEEMKYSDLSYAEKAYLIFAEQMKKSATTRACIFATKHHEATELLMKLMEQTGLISFIGKVNMDREAPFGLCEPSAEYSAFDTIRWLDETDGKYSRTMPIITPRFIPSCTDTLLDKLSEIRTAFKLPVQSHLSENKSELKWVKEHCSADFYGDAYDRHSLFGKAYSEDFRTIMAHCVYSTDDEIRLIRDNGVFVAHCPASNTNLSSGIAPIRKYLDYGIKVGLGSDVAGGHTESILRAITDAVQVSKLYGCFSENTVKPVTFNEAFYMATKGGGEFFGKVGSFESGYEFDAVVLDDSMLKHPQELTVEQRLERAAYLSFDINGICAKFAAGRKIYESI